MFGDIAKTFGKNFLLGHFAPAAALCSLNVVLVAEGRLPLGRWYSYWTAFGVPKGLAILIAITVAAILLRHANHTVVRIYEGYCPKLLAVVGVALLIARVQPWLPLDAGVAAVALAGGLALCIFSALHGPCTRLHQWRYRRIEKRLDAMADGGPKRELEYTFRRQYPRDVGLARPTKFGNITRSFEHHPRFLYNIEPITGWVKLVALIPEPYRAQIEEAETAVSFLLNISLGGVLFGAELLAIGARESGAAWELGAAAAFLAAFGAYRAACGPAIQWGEYVRSAFDLYRLDLLKQMAVAVPAGPITLQQEKDIWRRVQRATFYVEDPGDLLKIVLKPASRSQALFE